MKFEIVLFKHYRNEKNRVLTFHPAGLHSTMLVVLPNLSLKNQIEQIGTIRNSFKRTKIICTIQNLIKVWHFYKI